MTRRRRRKQTSPGRPKIPEAKMAAKRGPGGAPTKTSGDGGASDASSKPPGGAPSAPQPAQGTSSAPQPAQEGTSSALPGPKLVGSVLPVVRPRTQVGRIRGCFRGGTMTLFQAIAAPEPATGVLGAKKIPSPRPGSSSKDFKRSQDDRNPSQGQPTGTSGTPVASQVGQRGLQVY